jgi:hypothetical protein
MIIDRRTFIQGSTLAASSTLFATLVPCSLAAQPQSVESEPIVNETASSSVVFKIDGWNQDGEQPEGNEVFIWINQSWRAAWR